MDEIVNQNEPAADASWKETVRDIYDLLHFGRHTVFTGDLLAKRLVALIEERHEAYFCGAMRSSRRDQTSG